MANSQRVGELRSGYRHGHRARTLSTSLGATTIALAKLQAGPPGWTRQLFSKDPGNTATPGGKNRKRTSALQLLEKSGIPN